MPHRLQWQHAVRDDRVLQREQELREQEAERPDLHRSEPVYERALRAWVLLRELLQSRRCLRQWCDEQLDDEELRHWHVHSDDDGLRAFSLQCYNGGVSHLVHG